MEFRQQTALSKTNKREIISLWNNEYPEKLRYHSIADFENYLQNLNDQSHLLLIGENHKIEGWYFSFLRENEKWFALVIDSKFQGKGFGTMILDIAKETETELNGWVIDHNNDKKSNGEPYRSPLHFYLKKGFKKLAAIRLEIDKISAVKIQWVK